jgi:hypothetical protein
MKALISLALLVLFTVLASAAMAQGVTSGQNIYQSANNSALLYGNASSVNQSNVQNATQNAQINGNASLNQNASQIANQNAQIYGNASLNQSTSQMANQSAQVYGYAGSNQTAPQSTNQAVSQNASQVAQASGNASTSQSITQNAYQNMTWNIQNYWINNQTTTVTTEQRSILEVRTDQFLTDYSNMRMYIMPFADFRTVYAQRGTQVFVLDVSSGNIAASTGMFPGAVWIPLTSLASRLSEIPAVATVAVISDSDIDSAVAVTMLRMYGYNAWIVPSGVCSWQQSGGWMVQQGTTGTAYAGGVASASQTSTASSYATGPAGY